MFYGLTLLLCLGISSAHEEIKQEYVTPTFEEFVMSHYMPRINLPSIRRLLGSPEEDKTIEKEAEREETISKLKVYCVGGLVIGGLVFFLQSSVHNSNNRSWLAEMLRANFVMRKCCFAYKPADYAPVTESADEENVQLTSPTTTSNNTASPPPEAEEPEFHVGVLAGCVVGLLVSYLTWGFFQEQLMTQEYHNIATGGTDRFKEAEFLVFLNRLSGLVISTIAVSQSSVTKFSPPYMFLFCSMSNIMSAWFQYESLKFITFPMQVLAKSCKVLFTMLMGVAVNNKSFSPMEYANAVSIAVGLVVFKYGQESGPPTDDSLNAKYFAVGLTLISGYICSDSFTSNWQSRIFKKYSISPLQMMRGVNMFSASFSLLSCAPALLSTCIFFKDHPKIILHAGLMSLCSGTGQLFIFYTIKRFGAVVFAVAMTTRLIMSVLLSIVIFSHPINAMGFFGMFITFVALIVRVDMKRRAAKKKTTKTSEANVKTSAPRGSG